MESAKNILVVCVDRDNDFGRKAGIHGPIVGKRANINSAAKLALADPEESDSNTVFAAIKKYDEAKKLYANSEVVTLIGAGKFGLESDKVINEQLDSVLEKFPADGIILVTDGAEDDQVIPILQSRAKIISKQTVIIKQAREVEGTYYAIKEALKDPFLSRVVFGIPGIILLILLLLPTIGTQLVAGAIGAFLLLYGFGVFDAFGNIANTILKSISTQRASFPFYIATLFVFAFGIITSYNLFMQQQGLDITVAITMVAIEFIFFTFIAAELYIIGKSTDLLHMKKAYKLRDYFLSGVSLILIWFILDAAKTVIVAKADLTGFLVTIIVSFGLFLLAFEFSKVMDVRKRITRLLIGLPVYDRNGKWIGKVSDVSKDKNAIEYTLIKHKAKEPFKAKKKEFVLREGRVFLMQKA